ncbi:MAG TPA: FtsX-like permease family protein [Holophaga sp.]|nr:FtsX-like permease family protein [Holophaga sp.]
MAPWIERQLGFLESARASLARRWARTLVLLAVQALLVFLLGSLFLLAGALRREAAATLAGAPQVILQKRLAGRLDTVPPGALEALGPLRGLRAAHGRLWGFHFDPVTGATLTVWVPAEPMDPGTVRVGSALAALRGWGPGDRIALLDARGEPRPFRVVEVLPPSLALAAGDQLFMGESDFRGFFAYPEGHWTDLALEAGNPKEARTLAAKAVRTLPGTRAVLREDLVRAYGTILDWRQGLGLAALAGAILAFAILAWDRASGLSAEERRELAVLRALGWDPGHLMALKGWEGALVALGAFLGGYTAAYVHVFHFGGGLLEPLLRGGSAFPARLALAPGDTGPTALLLLALAVAPAAAAALVPTWRAAAGEPSEGMRP